MNMKRTLLASVDEITTSELYMTVKATLFTVPDAYLNGVRCTEAFLDEIVANQDKYIGLPLCADISKLEEGKFTELGHMYDPETDTFATSVIGSFFKFEKEETATGYALAGYARVLKRNKAVCSAIGQLFAEGSLKFSFEICCGAYTEKEDGTVEIDRDEKNYLEGMCVVSFPACPEAVAKMLVAEIKNAGRAKEMSDMDKENEVKETAEVAAPQVAETEPETEAKEPEA